MSAEVTLDGHTAVATRRCPVVDVEVEMLAICRVMVTGDGASGNHER